MKMRRIVSLVMTAVMVLTLAAAWAVPAASAEKASESSEKLSLKIEGSKYVAKGKSIKLKASSPVEWKSSNDRIAKVNKKGMVYGLMPGRVRITAISKFSQSIRASIEITVTAKPVKKVTIQAKTKELYMDGTRTVKLKAKAGPSGSAQSFEWKSSNSGVAKVNNKGKVTAVGPGVTQITATATDGSKKKASVTITVYDSIIPTPESNARYFALLIGNGQGYPAGSTLTGPPYDIQAMKNMLSSLKQNWQVTVVQDATADQMRSAIGTAYSGATAEDVCLFYYTGHGYSNTYSDDNEGALVGVDKQPLTGMGLASALNAATPGKVIVLLDSCGSGGLIYQKDGGKTLTPEKEARIFVDSMMDAFAWFNKKYRQEKGISDKIGELLADKFEVIAACAYQTTSSDMYSPYTGVGGGAYTISLVSSAGFTHPYRTLSGINADSDGNGKITTMELYNGIRSGISQLGCSQVTQGHVTSEFVAFIK